MFPAEAFAAELKRRGQSPVLITDERGAPYSERPMSAFFGIPVHTVRAGTFSPRHPLKAANAALDILAGIIAAFRVERSLRPALAVGFGGYPSLPAMLAARWAGVPRLIHEQNAVLGRANRWLAPGVEGIATSFEGTRGVRPKDQDKVCVTGNPVRGPVAYIGSKKYLEPGAEGRVNLLVMGGSLGARIMGDVVPDGIGQLSSGLRQRIKVVQQCREEDLDQVRAKYRDSGIAAELVPFIDNVAERLAHAHLVISRAGASTIAEVTAAGRPALLVPYPGHGDQQQAANANALVEAGGAWVVEQPSFTPAWVAERIDALAGTPGALTAAAGKARSLGQPDAAAQLADLAEHLAAHPGDGARAGGRSGGRAAA